jgi:hypothetical protein
LGSDFGGGSDFFVRRGAGFSGVGTGLGDGSGAGAGFAPVGPHVRQRAPSCLAKWHMSPFVMERPQARQLVL